METILVTGGTGFIGSHTVLLLLKSGYRVYILDSHVNSSKIVLEKIQKIIELENNIDYKNKLNYFKLDLRDISCIDGIFKRAKEDNAPIKSVIHFAGLKSVGESNKNPLLYWDNNVSATIILLKIMDKYSCRNLVFSSSATIYSPSPNNSAITETNPIGPINTYGNTKATIETILNDLSKSSPEKWRIANLRYFNPIGAHPSGLLGENPIGKPNNIFPLINLVAAKEIRELNIFGNDWDTPDGTCIRDYIHVMDLANGHILALEYLRKGNSNIINLNLGTGRGTSVLELINIFKKVNRVEIPYSFSSRRVGDNGYVVADNKLACETLKWKPESSLEDMCKDGWNWKNRNMRIK